MTTSAMKAMKPTDNAPGEGRPDGGKARRNIGES